MNTKRGLLFRKVVDPLLSQLKQGADPRRLAWSVSLGFAIGVFPVLGSTTILCGAAGATLRLNHVAMQVANYLAYAPQLALIPVWIRWGERMAGAKPIVIDLVVMKARFAESPSGFFQDFGWAACHGILAWAVVMPLPTLVLALFLSKLFKKISNSKAS